MSLPLKHLTNLDYFKRATSIAKMSAAKRPASNSFGSSQMVVKRQKSNTDINGKAVTVTNGGSASGALIQAVSFPFPQQLQIPMWMCAELSVTERRPTDGSRCLGATHKWIAGSHNGAHRSLSPPVSQFSPILTSPRPFRRSLRRPLRSLGSIHSLGLHGPIHNALAHLRLMRELRRPQRP